MLPYVKIQNVMRQKILCLTLCLERKDQTLEPSEPAITSFVGLCDSFHAEPLTQKESLRNCFIKKAIWSHWLTVSLQNVSGMFA